jgi:hypothetical protein
MDEVPLFCDRCSVELTPGQGTFYVVRIEAFADPTPPLLDEPALARDPRREIRRLLASLADLSEQEILDQIHRRLVLYLCNDCYCFWIERPTGDVPA